MGIKLLLGSDYHGSPRLIRQALAHLPEVDAYINCGDFCSKAGKPSRKATQGFHPAAQAEVVHLQSFLAAVESLGKPWLFLPGNHDPAASVLNSLVGRWGRAITQSCCFEWLGLQVLAVPWTPPCGWSWSLTSAHLQELLALYSQPPRPIDLLLTHAPPRGFLDEGGKWYHRRTPTLRPLLEQVQPRYYICGHMHWDGGKVERWGSTLVINTALHNMVLEIH
jgi:Icc-related predicted phosphoesterase